MSKAFTREDEDAGFEMPARSSRLGDQRLTAYGARLIRERLAREEESLTRDRLSTLVDDAEIVEPAEGDVVALGARVRLRSAKGKPREIVIVTPDEVGLVPFAVSARSPLAAALLGARVGDEVEVELPAGTEELTVVALEWPR